MHLPSVALAALLLLPAAASAHGALQKVADATYIVNLTPAPLSPFVGETQKNMVALGDLRNNFIEQPFVADVRVAKFSGDVIFEAKGLVATGGLLPFAVTYPEEGMYEIFIAFRLPGGEFRESEDFFMQVRSPAAPDALLTYRALAMMTLFGGVLGWGVRRSFAR